MPPSLTFVIGGAASGKSQVAEKITLNSGLRPIYIATSQIRDAEMQEKVDRHRARRGPEWVTVNAPIDPGTHLSDSTPNDIVLLDCATMWLTNVMLDNRDIEAETGKLTDALAKCPAPVVVVSNEVGQGIVPDNVLARSFREAQGRLNIVLAAQANSVLHVVAGLARTLK